MSGSYPARGPDSRLSGGLEQEQKEQHDEDHEPDRPDLRGGPPIPLRGAPPRNPARQGLDRRGLERLDARDGGGPLSLGGDDLALEADDLRSALRVARLV